MTKEYREEQEEKIRQSIKDYEQKEYERWLKEKNKKPKMYGVGSKFTRPKKKRR
jgi:hypothetical protein